MDTLLEASVSGSHMGWNAGVFVDRIRLAQVGLSYHHNGVFSAEGEGTVTIPEGLGGGTAAADATVEIPLPDVVFAWVNSELNDDLTVGAGIEVQRWGDCCGGEDGDIVIGLLSEDGDALGPEDGLPFEVDSIQYSPRRLWNASNYAANAGFDATDRVWFGGRVGYNQNAVPDYAVSATNLDFQNVGFVVAGRYTLGKVTLGLSYSKYFLTTREVTNSAWDVRDTEDPKYVDERFSPSLPYKASGSGIYQGKVDIVGVRVGAKF
jgi:long-subunit fatty acid transport protein